MSGNDFHMRPTLARAVVIWSRCEWCGILEPQSQRRVPAYTNDMAAAEPCPGTADFRDRGARRAHWRHGY